MRELLGGDGAIDGPAAAAISRLFRLFENEVGLRRVESLGPVGPDAKSH